MNNLDIGWIEVLVTGLNHGSTLITVFDWLSEISMSFKVVSLDVGIGCPVIGCNGVEKILEFSLNDDEKTELNKTLEAVKKTVAETEL